MSRAVQTPMAYSALIPATAGDEEELLPPLETVERRGRPWVWRTVGGLVAAAAMAALFLNRSSSDVSDVRHAQAEFAQGGGGMMIADHQGGSGSFHGEWHGHGSIGGSHDADGSFGGHGSHVEGGSGSFHGEWHGHGSIGGSHDADGSFGGHGSHVEGGSGSFHGEWHGHGSIGGSHDVGGSSGGHGSNTEASYSPCPPGHVHQCPAEWSSPGNAGGYHCLHKLANQASTAAYVSSGGACRPAAHGPFPFEDCQVQCGLGKVGGTEHTEGHGGSANGEWGGHGGSWSEGGDADFGHGSHVEGHGGSANGEWGGHGGSWSESGDADFGHGSHVEGHGGSANGEWGGHGGSWSESGDADFGHGSHVEGHGGSANGEWGGHGGSWSESGDADFGHGSHFQGGSGSFHGEWHGHGSIGGSHDADGSFGGHGSHVEGGSGSFHGEWHGHGSIGGSHDVGGSSGGHGSNTEASYSPCPPGHVHQCPAEWSSPGNAGGYHCLHKLANQASTAAYVSSGGACRPAAHGPFPFEDCQAAALARLGARSTQRAMEAPRTASGAGTAAPGVRAETRTSATDLMLRASGAVVTGAPGPVMCTSATQFMLRQSRAGSGTTSSRPLCPTARAPRTGLATQPTLAARRARA
ncbi:unnamed protein product [Effrenium voratum]|uniref:Uncharacterized protein n=1 Tax=Effrenium voratum TaxID=2562239 RepID=A0AA36JIP2_9DINO|nr:unnamed protein product [Effrenium voratum]